MRADRDSQYCAERQHAPQEPGATNGAAPRAPVDRRPTEAPEPDVLKLLLRQLQELGEYVSYYVMAKTESLKFSLGKVVLGVVLAVLGFLSVLALIVTASWLLLIGMAEALGALCGDRSWAGNLMTGALVFGALGIGMYCTLAKRAHSSRERTVEKYEQRQARQHARFGHDVSDRAAAATADKK